MTEPQRLWWRQAASDHTAFLDLARGTRPRCHALHHLQMSTEKLCKAYIWGSGQPPPRSHAGLSLFLRLLGQIARPDRERVARTLGFGRYADFQAWTASAAPLARDVERLAPDLAGDGPNPEYPWPHAAPAETPAEYRFPVWTELQSPRGRNLLRFVRRAVERFPQYADV